MSDRSEVHASFTLERSYPAPPSRVFIAWTDPEIKARWFAGPDEWERGRFEIDLRVGGRETTRWGPAGGAVNVYEARYHDIVPERRIVYSYTMQMGGTRISVSLATAAFVPDGNGTRLTYTEQGVFLDGLDTPEQRERGSGWLLDALAAELETHPPKV